MIFLNPVRARFKKDILLREKILKENFGEKHQIGFEVIFPGGPKGDLKYEKEIIKNLKKYSEDPNFYITIHNPIERENFNSQGTDLASKKGIKTLKRVLELAKEINARLVNIHPERFYFGKDLVKKEISLSEKRKFQRMTKERVIEAKKSVDFKEKITFENVIYAMMGDYQSFMETAEKMVFDPLLITAEDFPYFTEIKENVGVCIDTSHYGLSKSAINNGLKYKLDRKKIIELGLFGMPKEDIKKQPDLVTLAKSLGEKLFYVHLSDYRGFWMPDKSCFHEGLPLGEGEFGEELKRFLRYLNYKNIPANIEIKDKNLKNLKETKKAVKWIKNNL